MIKSDTLENTKDFRISVAPMMDWTTKDYRFFARLFNPNGAWQYQIKLRQWLSFQYTE